MSDFDGFFEEIRFPNRARKIHKYIDTHKDYSLRRNWDKNVYYSWDKNPQIRLFPHKLGMDDRIICNLYLWR